MQLMIAAPRKPRALLGALDLRPHTVFATTTAAARALVQHGYDRRTYIGRRYDIYENERGDEWAVCLWESGLVTIEWPEQFT